MSRAVVHIGASHTGASHTGAHAGTPLGGGGLVLDSGSIGWTGDSADVVAAGHPTAVGAVGAAGAAVIPGLIDSYVHTAFREYTPRQGVISFLDSYLHGASTRVVSASEIHVPGRSRDVAGLKAPAVAAQPWFADYRPYGVTVHPGSVILRARARAARAQPQHPAIGPAGEGAR